MIVDGRVWLERLEIVDADDPQEKAPNSRGNQQGIDGIGGAVREAFSLASPLSTSSNAGSER